jgi:hypothetical protein
MLGLARYGAKQSLSGFRRGPGLGLYPADTYAGQILASATVLNDYGTPTFTRASTAYDPYNRVTAISGARRRRLMPLSRTLSVNADLIEGARTNLCIQSSTLNSWATRTDVTITDGALTPADGTGTASRVLEGSAGTALVLSAAMTITAGRILTSCVRFKFNATNSWVSVRVASDALANGWRVWANISTGVVGSQLAIGTGAVVGTPVLTSLGSGEYMLCSMGTVAAAATACQIHINSATADTSTTRVNAADYYAWGAQVEQMPASSTTGFPSSYIATTSATVTRAGDNLSVAYVFGQTGTILALLIPYGWTGDQDGVSNYIIFRDDLQSTRATRSSATLILNRRGDAGGTEGASTITPSFVNGSLTHFGTTWDSTAIRGYIAGAANGTPDTTLTPPYDTNTTLNIGQAGGLLPFFGHVALLAWTRALSASELLAIYTAYPAAG